jgi:hypothetical protein
MISADVIMPGGGPGHPLALQAVLSKRISGRNSLPTGKYRENTNSGTFEAQLATERSCFPRLVVAAVFSQKECRLQQHLRKVQDKRPC